MHMTGKEERARKTTPDQKTTFYVNEYYEVIDGKKAKYVLAGNDRIALIKEDDGTYFFHKDHLGSTSFLTNGTGQIVNQTTEFLPFGLERDDFGQDTTDYKFTDQELDTSTGLYNYDARLYDPVLGTFITPDSIRQDDYDPQALNPYAYCRNNPLKYTDPSGNIFQLFSPDTYFDIASIIWGVIEFAKEPSWINLGAIGGDLVGAAIPGLTGVGASIRFSDNIVGGIAKEGIEKASKKPLLPDSYWINKKAPTQVTPVTRTVNISNKPSSKGGTYHSTTHYDEYGRQIGKTHRTNHGYSNPKGEHYHPNPHHHRRDPVTGEKLKDPNTGSRTWPGLFGN